MSNDIYRNYPSPSEYIISPKTNNNQTDYSKDVKKVTIQESGEFSRDYKIDDERYGQAKARKKIIGYVKK